MLPQFYLDYLKTYLPDSELLTLQILVWLLQVHRQVRIERLASSFPYPIKCESRRKKIQRFLVLPRLSLTLEKKQDRFNVVIYWRRKYKNKQLPSPWYLLTNLEDKAEVIKIFAARGGIEAMFRDCKSGGYNLEGSQANPQRLTNLILLIAIAYTVSCLSGLKIRNTGYQEYVNRLKIEDKNRPRHSYFWTGLYGTTWVASMDVCWQWVSKLMLTAINKLPFYQQGLRAMKHIQCLS